MKFLYNGIALPPLPEWDKAAYPYVYMVYNPDAISQYNYFLYCFEQRPEWKESYGLWRVRVKCGYSTTRHTGEATDNWTDIEAYPPTSTVHSEDEVVWTNFDILNAEDGSVFYAASCPIDVETDKEIHDYCLHTVPVPQLNPAALMQGFATMLPLRRNRT